MRTQNMVRIPSGLENAVAERPAQGRRRQFEAVEFPRAMIELGPFSRKLLYRTYAFARYPLVPRLCLMSRDVGFPPKMMGPGFSDLVVAAPSSISATLKRGSGPTVFPS